MAFPRSTGPPSLRVPPARAAVLRRRRGDGRRAAAAGSVRRRVNVAEETVEIRELQAGETHRAHEAMRALRTTWTSEREFVEHVDGTLRPAGYRLVGAVVSDREQAVAVAGFRVGDSLAWGRYLYVDDLSTAPEARRQGHGGALLDWLLDEGRRLGCGQLNLDSGTGSERFDAHRLYHKHGLAIYSHHFARGL
jgi:GNAT superfamily N-acetyltransferase